MKRYWRLIACGLVSLVAADLLALIPPWLVKDAIDALPSISSARSLLPYLGAILAIVAGQGLFRFFWRRSLFGLSRWIEFELRNDLFRHFLRLDKTFFLRYSVGELMSRSTNDLKALREVVAFFGLLVVDSTLTIGTCIILMSVIDPTLTVAVLAPLPLLSLSFFHFGRRVRAKAAEIQEEIANLTHLVQETLAGIRVVHAYTLEALRRRFYLETTDRYIRKNIEMAGLRGLFYASLAFFAGTAGMIVLWMGGMRVLEGRLSLGEFVAFGAYLAMLTWPMMSLGFMVNLLQRGRASLDRIEEVLRENPVVTDPPEPIPACAPSGALHLKDVGFRYPGSDRWVLSGISVEIARGAKVGITGPVGCGKSTLLALIPRIYDPTEGRILVDGRDLRHIGLSDLRGSIAWVAQEPFLFSESIAENLTFGALRYSPEDAARAARLARLDRDKDAFPKGLDTLVGERGVMISGGQKQRVAVARALLRVPRILLLDDAFAHLDQETASEVIRNILAALPGATVLFTSHRASILMGADRILVMRDGRVVEDGAPEDLKGAGGYFERIFRQQELMDEIERIDPTRAPR